jgi:hypothetical protein
MNKHLQLNNLKIDLPKFLSVSFALFGFGILIFSIFNYWFHVPVLHLQANNEAIVNFNDLTATLIYKAILVILLPLSLVLSLKIHEKAIFFSRLLGIILAILLFYPFFLMYISVDDYAKIAWLQAQHKDFAWLGGDVFTNQELNNIDFKRLIYIINYANQFNIIQIPHSYDYLLQFSRLREFIEWFGYTAAFNLFVAKGWFLALGGTLLLLMHLYHLNKENLYFMTKAFLLMFFNLSLYVLIILFTTTHFIDKAHKANMFGFHEESLKMLNIAAQILPMIKVDSYFIYQRGLIKSQLNINDNETKYYRAILTKNSGFYENSLQQLHSLLNQKNLDINLKRQVLRILLIIGINNINSMQLERGIKILEKVLKHNPIDLKANYALQLAYLRNDELDKLDELIIRFKGIYKYFNTLSKKSLLAFAVENAEISAYLHNDIEKSWQLHYEKSRP